MPASQICCADSLRVLVSPSDEDAVPAFLAVDFFADFLNVAMGPSGDGWVVLQDAPRV